MQDPSSANMANGVSPTPISHHISSFNLINIDKLMMNSMITYIIIYNHDKKYFHDNIYDNRLLREGRYQKHYHA